MKHIVLIAAFGLSWTIAHAQIEKGNFLIGSSSQLSMSRSEIPQIDLVTQRKFEVDVNVGYFVLDNLGVGYSLSREKIRFLGSDLQTSSISPFLKYFLSESVFAKFGFGFGHERVRGLAEDPNTGERVWIENITQTRNHFFNIGYAIWITERISLEPVVSYTYHANRNFSGSRRELSYRMGLKFYLR